MRPVFYETLEERLRTILENYRRERIDGAERLRQMTLMLDDARNPTGRARDIGVDRDVAPFFDLIAAGADEPERYKEVATEIVGTLRSLAVIDWHQKEDIKREMRREMKRALRAAGYPGEGMQDLVVRLTELAERRIAA